MHAVISFTFFTKQATPPPTPAPPAGVYNYTIQAPSKYYKAVSFVLNTDLVDYATAETRCEGMNGYLVSYENLEEQIEVEDVFLSQYTLDFTYYNKYWIGLRVPQGNVWPHFEWAVPPVANWSHWGGWRHWKCLQARCLDRCLDRRLP